MFSSVQRKLNIFTKACVIIEAVKNLPHYSVHLLLRFCAETKRETRNVAIFGIIASLSPVLKCC